MTNYFHKSKPHYLVIGQTGFLTGGVIKLLDGSGVDFTLLSLRSYDHSCIQAALSGLPQNKQIKVYFASWPTNASYDSATHFEYLEGIVKPFFARLLTLFPGASVVSLGTCLEYGLKEGPLSESINPEPTTALGVAKLATYEYLKTLTLPGNLIHLRIFYPYSYITPRPGSLIWHLQHAVTNNCDVFKMSHGNQMRDFIPLDQITEVLFSILSFEAAYPVDILNIGTGQPTKVIDLVNGYLSYHAATLSINRGYYQVPLYEPDVFYSAHDPNARDFLTCLV